MKDNYMLSDAMWWIKTLLSEIRPEEKIMLKSWHTGYCYELLLEYIVYWLCKLRQKKKNTNYEIQSASPGKYV